MNTQTETPVTQTETEQETPAVSALDANVATAVVWVKAGVMSIERAAEWLSATMAGEFTENADAAIEHIKAAIAKL